MCTITDRNRKPTSENHHLVSPGHGHQKAGCLFGQRRGDLQATGVSTHEREILGKTDQFSSPACSQINLFLGSSEIALRFGTAGELHGRRQEITH